MTIGLVKENPSEERRIGLTPGGVQSLASAGARVYVQREAGLASHFSDEDYEKAEATIVYSEEEVYGRSDVVLKISPPTEADCAMLSEGQTLLSFLHLAVARQKVVDALLAKEICAIAYELIEDDQGDLVILQVMSEIAGQMSTQIAARYLESHHNGRGIVMGGIAGVPPASVVIIGAGTVGRAAARMALATGAEVSILDKDLARLRRAQDALGFRVGTAVTNTYNLRKALQFADVVIGAVLMKGERAPHLVTEDMVRGMKPGSIVIDVSIDQGGCIATSRPTTLANPTYVVHNVIHYCVPNIPASVARTATYGMTNALLPYLLDIVQAGIDQALITDTGFARGVCTYHGFCTNDAIARRFSLEKRGLHEVMLA